MDSVIVKVNIFYNNLHNDYIIIWELKQYYDFRGVSATAKADLINFEKLIFFRIMHSKREDG